MTLDETIATLQESARENSIPTEVVAKLIADLRKVQKQEAALRKSATAKRSKTQHVVLLVPAEAGASANADRLGFVLQLEEGAHPNAAYDRVVAAGQAFNASKRGRTIPVKTVGQTLEVVPARFYKTSNPSEITRVKTRVACAALTIRANDLPGEKEAA